MCHRISMAAAVWLLLGTPCGAALPTMERPAADQWVLQLPARLPDDPAQALQQVLRSGDARALGLIEARLQADEGDQALLLRAYIAQHQHDYAQALALLDRLLLRRPRDAVARHVRVDVWLAQGEIRRAATECAALALGLDGLRGTLCTAALAARRGQTSAAQSVLRPLLDDSTLAAPLQRYAWCLAGDVALQAGDLVGAESAWEGALARDPADPGARLRLLRLWRAQGRLERIDSLLVDMPESDAVLMERAWLARARGQMQQAQAIAARLEARFQEAEWAGSGLELADWARWRAEWQRDLNGALALAKRNFETQRSESDERLLRDLAEVLDDRVALSALNDWRRSQGLPESLQ